MSASKDAQKVPLTPLISGSKSNLRLPITFAVLMRLEPWVIKVKFAKCGVNERETYLVETV